MGGGRKKKKLPGLELAFSNSKIPKPFGPADCFFRFCEKNIAVHTADAHVTYRTRYTARPKTDDELPQTRPCPGNTTLCHAVPFSNKYV